MKNIFDILSVADKELVHSAMLQFFIESDYWKGYFFNFLEYSPDKEKNNFYPKLEYSDSFQEGTKKKRIRFDLVLFKDNEQKEPILVIENKFKATPTVEQLELYDKFIVEKNDLFKGVPKILFVFCMDSVSGPVIKYCEEKNWKIIPYVKAIDKTPSALSLLNFIENGLQDESIQSKEELFLEKRFLEDYKDHLYVHQNNIIQLIKPDKEPWTFPKYDEKNRFYYLQFLLFIQKEIYDQFKSNSIKFSLNNDGGRNNTPSVNFWLDSDVGKKGCNIHAVYVSIDGDNLRLGFHYERPKDTNPISKEFIDDFILSLNDGLHDKKNIITLKPSYKKQVKSNESEDPRYSVYSILTGSLEGLKVMEVLDELPKIISSYFTVSLEFLKSNCKQYD